MTSCGAGDDSADDAGISGEEAPQPDAGVRTDDAEDWKDRAMLISVVQGPTRGCSLEAGIHIAIFDLAHDAHVIVGGRGTDLERRRARHD